MMAAERRVVDAGDDPYASHSAQAPPPAPAKRKIHSEDEPLPAPTNPPKRAKKATAGRSLSRKLTIIPVAVADDEPGPSTRPASSLAVPAAPPRQSSRARSPSELRPSSPTSWPISHPASSLHPPPVSSTTSHHKPHSASKAAPPPPSTSNKGKEKQTSVPPSTSISAGHSLSKRDVFGSREVGTATSRGRRRPTDVTLPLPLRETPLIDKNREMRSKANQRRRNSLEHQRRASESLGKNGGITQSEPSISVVPHPDVNPDQYHRHILADVPPAQRTRQLLVWSSSHAAGQASNNTAKGKNVASSSSNLPVLTADSTDQLLITRDAIVRMLADGTVDTTPFSEKGKDKAQDHERKLRPNPMNEKNKKRIDEWKSYIARADAEEKIWLSIKASANAQLAKLTEAQEAQSGSRKVKKPPEEWFPDLLDAVDERWRASARLARSASSLDTSEVIDTAVQDLLRSVELHVDELEDMVNTTYEMTHRAESFLHKFFTAISSQLSSRATYGRSNDPSALASRQASGMGLIELLSAPRDTAAAMKDMRIDNTMAALRALSRIKPAAPSAATSFTAAPSMAKEVGMERRMTAVPLRTPGKDRAKTPRRGSTPGRKVKR